MLVVFDCDLKEDELTQQTMLILKDFLEEICKFFVSMKDLEVSSADMEFGNIWNFWTKRGEMEKFHRYWLFHLNIQYLWNKDMKKILSKD